MGDYKCPIDTLRNMDNVSSRISVQMGGSSRTAFGTIAGQEMTNRDMATSSGFESKSMFGDMGDVIK